MNTIYDYAKKFLFCLSIGFVLSGCATKSISPEELKRKIGNFNLPVNPEPNKALVYCIYRGDDETIVFEDKVALYYAPSTAERFENHGSRASAYLEIFTLGLIKDSPSLEKHFIGGLNPGEYRTIQLDPGYYEFNRTLVTPLNHISNNEQITQVKLEAGKAHFVTLNGHMFYNRYAKIMEKSIYLSETSDLLWGKYILSKNFKLNKE